MSTNPLTAQVMSTIISAMVKHSKKMEIVERRAVVWDLIVSGHTIRQVADKLGVSVGTVHSDKRAIENQYIEEAAHSYEQYLAEQLMFIEDQLASALLDAQVKPIPAYDDAGMEIPGKWEISPAEAYKIRDRAATRADSLMARKAKLVGLDIQRVQVDKRVAVAVLGSGFSLDDL